METLCDSSAAPPKARNRRSSDHHRRSVRSRSARAAKSNSEKNGPSQHRVDAMDRAELRLPNLITRNRESRTEGLRESMGSGGVRRRISGVGEVEDKEAKEWWRRAEPREVGEERRFRGIAWRRRAGGRNGSEAVEEESATPVSHR
ncbi:hypothetical protein Scep_026055 [Stephania cephalantha]|uniref:Uncharacterized protein n=1 Tax=Stephania cephalantha TaxID=152367 RepID=A0AAP0EJF0_9MAGN